MAKKKKNGANGHANGHNGSSGYDSETSRALSDAQMELLRHALVEHGKRLGGLENMINKALQDLLMVKSVVAKTQARVKKIADKLDIDIDD